MRQSTPVQSTPQAVLDAMSNLHDEADRWRLAEQLLAAVPSGSEAFSQIVDDAKAAGIPSKFTATTLRLYRDTAARWPETKRVAHVTFSAHREAMVMPTIDDARGLLESMVSAGGPQSVTVSAVRKAIAASTGKPAKAAKAPAVTISLADLMRGGEKLIAAIRSAAPGLDAGQLDQMHAGLSAALTEVEKLRVKKSKRQPRKAAAPVVERKRPAKSTTRKSTVPAAVEVGDLRGI